MSSKRLEDLFYVLKAIRRIVDDADDDPPSSTASEWTLDVSDVAAWSESLSDASSSAAGRQRLATELRARATDAAANARVVAEELRQAGDLQELYLFCLVNIDDRERLLNTSFEAFLALFKLEDIKRALANVNLPPRTQNLGEDARGTDPTSPPGSSMPPPRPIKAGLRRPPKGSA